jgi:hypothetical protein
VLAEEEALAEAERAEAEVETPIIVSHPRLRV